MKALKSLLVLIVFSSLLLGCEKWKDLVHKEKDKDKKVYARENLSMSGLQEVPQRETPGNGSLNIHYNKTTKVLKYTVWWDDLTGIPIGSHIHGTAPRGVNAPIKHDFTALLPKATSGSFSNSVVVDGVAIKEDSLLLGYYYLNIHTPMFPGGEIRGQLEFE
jgi:hypothetical protein